jgi:hypothetical protein
VLAASLAAAQVRDSSIEISVVEGNGERYAAGTRAYRGITVEVVDDQGTAVSRARVVFRMPESGPGGTFSSGAAEEVSFTDARGRTSAWGIQWNQSPGECRISIFVSSGRARAGTTASVMLTGDPAAPEPAKPAAKPPAAEVEALPLKRVRLTPKPADIAPEPPAKRPGVVLSRNEKMDNPLPGSKRKWLLLAMGIGGAVGGGLLWRTARQGGAASPSQVPGTVLNPAPTRPTIGNPTITIGRP